MPDLRWYELHPPRGLALADVTGLLRPLASRPRHGLTKRTPLVVFELWSLAGVLRWRLGVERAVAAQVVRQFSAQQPGLGLVAVRQVNRPNLTLAAPVRLHGLAWPLRLDTATACSAELLGALAAVREHEAAVAQWVVGPAQRRTVKLAEFTALEALGLRSPGKPTSGDAALWRQKTAEPLFAVRGRIGASAAVAARAGQLLRSLAAGLAQLSSPHASLRSGRSSARAVRELDAVSPSVGSWSCILNAAELAAVLGWPLEGVDVPGVIGGHIALAPPALLAPVGKTSAGQRVLGESLHPSQASTLVHLPVATSQHHLHVIGPTGSGKSTLLAGLVAADMTAGHGVLVIEPKGDLVEDVLAQVPPERHGDVVVIDPANETMPVGVNVLAGPAGEAERRADQLVGLFRDLNQASWGPRTSDVLLHALLTIARSNDGTLADVPVLLSDARFRRQTLSQVSDRLVLAPFWAWYDGLSDAERGQVVAPVLNKLRAFQSRTALRRMLGQVTPRFSLDALFTERRIVLVSLNRGLLGPETANLLGALLLSQLWQAMQRRTAIPTTQRPPVMVVIDEFQDYLRLPLALADVLAQARGLGIGLTLAHQHLGQLPPAMRTGVLANARTLISFRPAPEDAKPLAAAFGGGLTADDLLRLGAYQACVRTLVDAAVTTPFSVRTRPLPPSRSDPQTLRATSVRAWGTDGAALDAALLARWQGDTRPPEGPVGVKTRRRTP